MSDEPMLWMLAGIIFFASAVIALALFDRWHRHYAWQQAEAETRRDFAERGKVGR